MMKMNSFRELGRLIRISRTCRQLFELYKRTLRNQVAKNLFGESYQVVTTVLTYRNSSCQLVRNGVDYAASEALVSKDFIFHTVHIIRAETLLLTFEMCLEKYQSAAFELLKDPNVPEQNKEIPPPSFTHEHPFSRDLFFRTARRFQQHRYENINTYIETLPSKEDELDMYWVARVLCLVLAPLQFGLFIGSWGCTLESDNFEELRGRPLLLAKFETTFLDTIEHCSEQEAEDQENAFYTDYDMGGGKGHMAMMIEKYKMNRSVFEQD